MVTNNKALAVSIVMNITGTTEDDVKSALNRVVNLIRQGNNVGFDSYANGSFSFNVSQQLMGEKVTWEK